MEQLFAPWRIEWVEREEDPIDGCPFCVLADREDDRENHLVARTEHSIVLLNNYPYNPGHVMVIPRRHTGSYESLPRAELLDHALLKQRTFEALEAAFSPTGINAGLNLGHGAGGSIDDHLHTHVVPRWSGDTNFMPVLSDTKVIVQALADTYDQLHEGFVSLDGATDRGDSRAVEFSFD